MAPMTVYGIDDSSCSQRVFFTLFEKEVPKEDWELVEVYIPRGEHKKPEHVARQPFGLIPVLDDGDVRVFESRAIIRYIARKYKGQGTELYGSNPKEEAAVDSWLEAEHANYADAAKMIVVQKVFHPKFGAPVDEHAVEVAVKKMSQALDVFEKRLGEVEYLAGNFSLADIACVPYTNMIINAAKITEPFESRPNVWAWWQRITSRPAWKETLALAKPRWGGKKIGEN